MTIKARYQNLQSVSLFDACTLTTISSITVDILTQIGRLENIVAITDDAKLPYVKEKISAIKEDLEALYERICNHVLVGESIMNVYNSLDAITTSVDDLLVYAK